MALELTSYSPACALSISTAHNYDALGRLVSNADSTGFSTSYTYDVAGNRVQISTSKSVLLPNEVLASGQQLTSPSGQVTLWMQPTDGNLVVYGTSGPTWASNTGGHPGAYAQMLPNGVLTVYAPQGNVLWVSDNYEGPNAQGVLQDDTNFVIYDVGGVPRWGSNNASLTNADRLLPSQTLIPGQQMVSSDGRFLLQFQDGGDLVLLFGTQILWTSGTSSPHPSNLVMQPVDGNLVMNDANGPIWASGTGGHPGAYMVMQTDGNLVIYAPQSAGGAALWASNTGGH